MDAPEADVDVELQRNAADLIAEFDKFLPAFLRKPDGNGGSRVRSRVRAREVHWLTSNCLDPFQELPQLLDPHLPKWIPFLSATYLEHLQTRRREKQRFDRSNLLVSVDYAICKILYTCCKIRGEKVIVHFLNVETKYLELLLTAIEEAEDDSLNMWSWEQRYVVLLWLSHLHLAPFDLSTISSVDIDDARVEQVSGLKLPPDLPGITLRVTPLAIKYLASSGKERDGAKALLVRIAMRRDMQALGVLESLVQWAISSLRPHQDASLKPPYYYLGILSFLSGILRSSSDTSDMDKFLPTIFNTVHSLSVDDNQVSKTIISFGLARKMILKVIRSATVSLLRQELHDMASTEIIETAIEYLLESLSDNDTPVRLAASKSLSIITLKLDPDMASQVVEAVLEAVNRNVLWKRTPGANPLRDLSAVNHLEWHGLMLTLSHLLYRRSPPANQLSDIVHALLLGLSFEQRGTSGTSVGSNVRDAACFGIWALARRYTTKELIAVPTHSVYAAKAHPASTSILQVLGTELVVTASLDSAGNIRRGASAALQELIGRHPDTVEKGIWVVQTVDYHSVARRSRAIEEVALGAARLSSQYGEAIEAGILGWRGIGDPDASARRVSGAAFGVLTTELASSNTVGLWLNLEKSAQLITARLEALQKRQVEERHGLLLCFAGVMDEFSDSLRDARSSKIGINLSVIHKVVSKVSNILEECKTTAYRKPELIVEAASKLVVSLAPVLQIAIHGDNSLDLGEGVDRLLSRGLSNLVNKLDFVQALGDQESSKDAEFESLLSTLRDVLPSWLAKNEPETISSAMLAALTLLVFSSPSMRVTLVEGWAAIVKAKPISRTGNRGDGYFHALVAAQPIIKCLQESPTTGAPSDIVCDAILGRWLVDKDIETRVTILQSITESYLLEEKSKLFLSLLRDGLNDYTTTARGDVGSHVRVQALRAVSSLWKSKMLAAPDAAAFWPEPTVKSLFYNCLRLSAEKLDRVRIEAQAVVSLVLSTEERKRFGDLTFSSQAYFHTLLELVHKGVFHPELTKLAKEDGSGWMSQLMAGFVTSADTGNEDLVIASRTALTAFCDASSTNVNFICNALLQNLKIHQGEDRVVVPTLEVIAFLFHVGLFQRAENVNLRSLCLQTQKAGYKTGNIRKIEACVKVYGGVVAMGDTGPGVQDARKRLGALMFHPWPKVRVMVVDELWGLVSEQGEKLMGVDWGAADKGQIRTVVQALRLE